MAYIQEPEEVLMNFLRANIDELTRYKPSFSNRLTTDTQTFDGDSLTTIFTLTNQPTCINSVTVGGVSKYFGTDYNIDLDNKKIKFRTAPTTGTDNISISFKNGTNWIYDDKAREDLKKSSYPRISILKLNESSTFVGVGDTPTYNSVTIQFDIITIKELILSNSGEYIEGEDVVKYFAREIINKIKSKWKTELIYRIHDFTILNNSSVPFNDSENTFRRIVEIQFLFRNNEETI